MCQSESSFKSLDLPNFWLVSFVSFCALLVLQLKSKLYFSVLTNAKRSWLNMTAGRCFVHSTYASIVENQTLPVSGCRLNEHDISARIFADDLYPISAFLTSHGDNDDTPCVCLSPFQQSTNEVLQSLRTGAGRRCDVHHFSLTRTMPWRSPFCESRGRYIVMDLLHFGQIRYDGFSVLPLTGREVFQGRDVIVFSALAALTTQYLGCIGQFALKTNNHWCWVTCQAMDPAVFVAMLNLSLFDPICLKTLALKTCINKEYELRKYQTNKIPNPKLTKHVNLQDER